jgi:hypothetical protein
MKFGKGQVILEILVMSDYNTILTSLPNIDIIHDISVPFSMETNQIQRIKDDIKKALLKLNKITQKPIEEQRQQHSENNTNPLLAALIDIGQYIYEDTLFSSTYDLLLKHQIDIGTVNIVTNIKDDTIPWDLAYNANNGRFFCEDFACGITILDESKYKETPNSFQRKTDVTKDDVFIIYGNDGGAHPDPLMGKRLSYVEEDCEWIAKLARKYFPGTTINLCNQDKRVFLKEWQRYHDVCKIVYMQGHFQEGKLYTPSGPIDDSHIYNKVLQQDDRKMAHGPIIFLNGCTTTPNRSLHKENTSSHLDEFTSCITLSKLFLEGGASACIMTRGIVYEGPASLFAKCFFTYFLKDAHPIGASINLARKDLQRMPAPEWQTSRLLYTLFGDPTQRLCYSESYPLVRPSMSKRLHSMIDVDARDYYETEIVDPWNNFDCVEITLSHLFREKNPTLGNRNFSEAVLDFLDRLGIIHSDIIEIGAGLGHIALNTIQARRERGLGNTLYRIVDISPLLIQAQKENLLGETVAFFNADARTMGFEDNSVSGLILSIGMIADLYSLSVEGETWSPTIIPDNPYFRMYLELIKNSVPQIENDFYLHLGAFDFLKELNRIMKKGSTAVIAEYLYTEKNSITDFGNHQECGIRFDHLKIIAEHFQFETAIYDDLYEVLGLDRNATFLSPDIFTQKNALNFVIPSLSNLWIGGKSLPVLAYTPEMFMLELQKPDYKLSRSEIDKIVSECKPLFHSITSTDFDTLYPDTWNYSFMVLKKV